MRTFGWLGWAGLVFSVIGCSGVDGSGGAVGSVTQADGFGFVTVNNGSGATIYADRTLGNTGACAAVGGRQEQSCVLKWGISIPSNATIISATIYLNVLDPSTAAFNVSPLKGYWDWSLVWWGARGLIGPCSWEVPGAKGSSDRKPALAQLTGVSRTGPVTYSLDPAVVQEWISDWHLNNGIIIDQPSTSDKVAFSPVRDPNVSLQPTLDVTYYLP